MVLQPTSLSRKYTVKLTYGADSVPRVYVVHPQLDLHADATSLPHVYTQEDQRLCLYLPGSGEWRNTMLLADMIVPWATEWLLYYEIWLVTGEWQGGGVHPSSRRKQER